MKKILSILIAIIFLITSMGMNFAIHYCGGRIEKVAVVLGNENVSCGMDENTGSCSSKEQIASSCCQNKHLQLKVKDNFVKPQYTQCNINIAKSITAILSLSDVFNASYSHLSVFNHSPPLFLKHSLSVWFQVFRL